MKSSTDYVKFYFEDNILISEFIIDNVLLDLKMVKEMVEIRLCLSEGKDVLWLYDIRKLKKMTKEARKYVDEDGQKGVKAGALLTNSAITKFIANTYLKVTSPKVPAKLFTDENEAIDWLVSHNEVNE
jgi:hypothetical protein